MVEKKKKEMLKSNWQENLRKLSRGEKITNSGTKKILMGLIEISWEAKIK